MKDKCILMSLDQWNDFSKILKKNRQYWVIANLMFYTARSLNKVLNMSVYDIIDEPDGTIFARFKKDESSYVKIKLDSSICSNVRKFYRNSIVKGTRIDKTLFISKTGLPLNLKNVSNAFRRAGEQAGIAIDGLPVATKSVQWSLVYEMIHNRVVSIPDVLEIFHLPHLPPVFVNGTGI